MSDKKLPPGQLVRHRETGTVGRTLPEVVNPVKLTVLYGKDKDGEATGSVPDVKEWGPVRHLVDPSKLTVIGNID